MTAAEPVPLDLYVLMDASLSMNETTSPERQVGRRPHRDEDFFDRAVSRPGSASASSYFPGVQPGAPATCTCDGPDQPRAARSGPATAARLCSDRQSTTAVTPLCIDDTTCASNQTCALIQDCGGGNYCAADGAGDLCRGCTDFAGYCHLRDLCDAAYYATPDVAVGAARGTAADRRRRSMTSLTAKMPAGYTPTGPALTGALMFARQRIASMPTTRWRSCW